MKSNSASRRLLVITYHFPPDGTVGGQRWAGLSKYLSRLGWEVHVVTAAAGSQEAAAGVHRHVRQRKRILNDVYKAAVNRLRRPPNLQGRVSVESTSPQRRSSRSATLAALRRLAGFSMTVPDQGRGWVRPAAAAARGLLRKEKFDVVVSSGPPHSAHFAALLATRGRATPFWIDMRDPWSVTHEMDKPTDRVISAERWVLRRFERIVFPRAERVIVNTREFAAALRTSDPDLDVIHFPNGIDLELIPTRDIAAVKRGSIAYVGTLYGGRNLSKVFAAISALLRDRPEAASELRLNIAGQMQPRHREELERDIAEAGLTSMVKIHGMLPRGEALELLGRSHLALVLAQDQPMCVPAKVYECVGACIPTLVIAEATGAAASEARRIGAMTIDSRDVEGMRSLLEDMLADRLPITIAPKAAVSYADLAVEMDTLLRSARR